MKKLLLLIASICSTVHYNKPLHQSNIDVFTTYVLQHLNQCSITAEGFEENTQVLCLQNYMAIKNITLSTHLKSLDDHYQTVLKKEPSQVSWVYTITLDNQQTITAAAGQQFFEQHSYSFKKASLLSVGDQLGCYAITNIVKKHGYFTVYTLSTSDHVYLLNHNIITHNANIADIAGLTIQIGSCCLTHPVVAAISRSISLIKYAWYIHNIYTDIQQRATNLQQVMQDQEIVIATREYFQTRYQQLTDLLKHYTQLQQAVIALCNQSAINTALLLLPATTNLTTVQLIPQITIELLYNSAQRQQLLEIRQKTLIDLEQKITSLQIALMLQLQDQYDRLNARLVEFAPLLQNAKNICNQQVSYHDRFRASQIMHNMLYGYIAAKESLDNILILCNTLSLLCQFYQHPQNAIILKQSTNLLDVCSEITQKINEINQYKPNACSYLQQMIDATQRQALRSGLFLQQDINNIMLRVQNDRQKKNQQENNNALAKKSNIQFPTPPDDPEEDDDKNFNPSDPDDFDQPNNNHQQVEFIENNKGHIFGDREGHVPDNLRNRRILKKLVANKKNKLSNKPDSRGNFWYEYTLPNGKQWWAKVREKNNICYIENAGLNLTPKSFDPSTGLSRNINQNPIK